MPRGIKLTTETFIAKAKEIWGDRFDYSKVVYVSNKTPVVIVCPDHGEVCVEPRFHTTSKTQFGCPKCSAEAGAKKRSHTKIEKYSEKFLSRAKDVHGGRYNYSKVVYGGQTKKVTIICSEHGEFIQSPIDHLSGCGCQKCGRDRIRVANQKPFAVFVNEANKIHKSKYTYDESSYVSANTTTKILCPEHGEFWSTPGNHLDKSSGCPKCCCVLSKVESEVRSWFSWSEFSNRSVLAGRELDMLSEEYKIAVEINGIYWHSEGMGKDSNYHLSKTEVSLSKGYDLMQFYDIEVSNKSEVVRSMLNNKFGSSKKVHARKCKVVEISHSEAKLFLEANHLAGISVASLCYGLTLNDDLVSVMTFSKPRFSTHEWEMIRFATKIGLVVVGGASKLFKAFISNNKPETVVTYANRRYSKGEVYSVLGFEFSHNTRPNYDYYKGSKRVSRYSAQKHKLSELLGDRFDPAKSEHQNMVDNGFHKVYDCGNSVFVWKNQR